MAIEQRTETIIEPSHPLSLNLRELWDYRELFFFFTWRDIKVKFKQTLLGGAWVILQPLLAVLIFSLFFGRGLKVPSEGIPYPVFAFSGLILWNVFSSSIANAGNSMVSNAQIIKKIYFPRLIIPFSSILVACFDFVVSLVAFLFFTLFFDVHVDIGSALLFWPAAVLLTIGGSLGLGCWLAALNVKYRDFRHIIPFLIQVLLFVTPVIYPISIIHSEEVKFILSLNPMFCPIELFRHPLGSALPEMNLMWVSMGSSFALLLVGIFYFKRTEDFFADIA